MQFETDVFIDEVHKRPCLWNSKCPEYLDKVIKLKNWNELVDIYARPGSSGEDRKRLCTKLQQKWRNIRDNFVKQLKRNALANETGIKFSTPYGYFNQLQFLNEPLAPYPKKSGKDATKSDQDDESSDNDSSDSNEIRWSRKRKRRKRSDVGSKLVATLNDSKDAKAPSASKKKKMDNEIEESRLVGVLTKTLNIKNSEEDEDRLFFLSLVKDFKKIPEDKQLRTKLELIRVINDARESMRVDPIQEDPIQEAASENSESAEHVYVKIEEDDNLSYDEMGYVKP